MSKRHKEYRFAGPLRSAVVPPAVALLLQAVNVINQ